MITEMTTTIARLAGEDIDIMPETVWATETTQNMPADLDFNAMLDAMPEAAPVLTKAQKEAYDWGWTAWEIGLSVRNLQGWARRGWRNAHRACRLERRAEQELFAQMVNGRQYE